MKNFLRLSYLFLGGEGPPKNHSAVLESPSSPVDGQGHLLPQASDAESQLSLTGREKAGVERVALFVALVYCKQWHEAPISVKAPLNDVLFLEILKGHTLPKTRCQGSRTSPATPLVVRFRGNAGLAFFDSRIDVEEKKADGQGIGQARLEKEGTQAIGGKKMTMSSSLSSLCHFEDTVPFFRNSTRTRGSWQRTRHCGRRNGPIQGRSGKRALGLRVVNDAAERGIALVPALPGVHEVGAQEKISSS
ncbi:hypothetical protein GWK47_053042 [Chionoecetes opilio]|uniref:Uncharacterized protein n=1 Tax=Chionoecetes opilio TaxID=41210 RepID=A0A8J5CR29_CHIOP|nr:hypothetical protein GWK47_053042 [Chionoecetes opilio]